MEEWIIVISNYIVQLYSRYMHQLASSLGEAVVVKMVNSRVIFSSIVFSRGGRSWVSDTGSAGLRLGLGLGEWKDELVVIDGVPTSYESSVWV